MCSRRPLPAEWHHQKLVFPSNYTYGSGPPAPTLIEVRRRRGVLEHPEKAALWSFTQLEESLESPPSKGHRIPLGIRTRGGDWIRNFRFAQIHNPLLRDQLLIPPQFQVAPLYLFRWCPGAQGARTVCGSNNHHRAARTARGLQADQRRLHGSANQAALIVGGVVFRFCAGKPVRWILRPVGLRMVHAWPVAYRCRQNAQLPMASTPLASTKAKRYPRACTSQPNPLAPSVAPTRFAAL
jgi:hypothetical protein